MSNQDNRAQLSAGAVSGVFPVFKFGRNENVPSNQYVTLWEGGGLYEYFQPTLLRVSSDSADDTEFGTGARAIRLSGLDADFKPYVEVVDLDGTNSIVTVRRFSRMYRAQVWFTTTGGGYDRNAPGNIGTITVVAPRLGPDILAGVIEPGAGQSAMALFSVATGFTGVLSQVYITADSVQKIDARFMVREPDGAFNTFDAPIVDGGPYNLLRTEFQRVGEQSDIEIRVKAKTGSARVSGGFTLRMIDNRLGNAPQALPPTQSFGSPGDPPAPYWQQWGL